MVDLLLVSYVVCFVVGLLLSILLLFRNFQAILDERMRIRKNGKNGSSLNELGRFLQYVLSFFNFVQASIFLVDIIVITAT